MIGFYLDLFSCNTEPGLADMLEQCKLLLEVGDEEVWPLVEEADIPVEPTSGASNPPPPQ